MKCESNGICEIVASDMFLVDDDDELRVLVAEIPGHRLDAAEKAVARCPKQALSLEN